MRHPTCARQAHTSTSSRTQTHECSCGPSSGVTGARSLRGAIVRTTELEELREWRLTLESGDVNPYDSCRPRQDASLEPLRIESSPLTDFTFDGLKSSRGGVTASADSGPSRFCIHFSLSMSFILSFNLVRSPDLPPSVTLSIEASRAGGALAFKCARSGSGSISWFRAGAELYCAAGVAFRLGVSADPLPTPILWAMGDAGAMRSDLRQKKLKQSQVICSLRRCSSSLFSYLHCRRR